MAIVNNLNYINIRESKKTHIYNPDDLKTLCGIKVKKEDAWGIWYCECKKCNKELDEIKNKYNLELVSSFGGIEHYKTKKSKIILQT